MVLIEVIGLGSFVISEPFDLESLVGDLGVCIFIQVMFSCLIASYSSMCDWLCIEVMNIKPDAINTSLEVNAKPYAENKCFSFL